MAKIGPIVLQIHPFDSQYGTGWYYISVYGGKEGSNYYSLSVDESEPCIY